MVEGVGSDICGSTSFAVIHVVRDIVKENKYTKKSVHTRSWGRAAHGYIMKPDSVFKTITNRVSPFLLKIDSLEEPVPRFLGHLLMVAVDSGMR